MPTQRRSVLAFDFGASSGRAMLGEFDGKTVKTVEINRFINTPIVINDTLCWDISLIFDFVKQSIQKAAQVGSFDSIGIDTWGVDFGLINEQGDLIENPVHYRDKRTNGISDKVFKILSKQQIYQMTGIQFLHFNTLYQLKYLVDENPEILKKTKNILLLPDMIAYMLTGAIKTEITNASTTNLMNPNTFDWDKTLCEKLGIPTHIFPEIMDTGEIYGNLSERICNELGCKSVPVIAVATHDTASAVVSVPSSSDSFAYLSCGTWSLLGTELNHPCINNDTMQHNFTNEIGYDKTIRLLKNIMGLWLVQESKRCFSKDDVQISFAVLEQEALSSEPFLCYIDPDAPEFEAPGNIPERVQEYCRKTGQHVPKNRGEIMRCIYQSIAMKYKYCFNSLQHIANRSFNILHMVGGGIKDRLLCQMTADACGIAVHAGPVEATVMGNIAAQLISLAEIRDLKSAREIIGNSTDIKVHFPSQADVWEQKYTDFLRSVNL